MRRENAGLNEIIESMNNSTSNQTSKIKELQKTISDLQETKRRYLDEYGGKNEEIEQLKMRLNKLEEEANETGEYVAKLEAETGAIPELSAKLEKHTLEMSALNEAIQAKDEENEHLNTTINNLQSVIDDNQVSFHHQNRCIKPILANARESIRSIQ